MKNLEKLAAALFASLAELEDLQPGIALNHGWVNTRDLKAFETALIRASEAKLPEGLI